MEPKIFRHFGILAILVKIRHFGILLESSKKLFVIMAGNRGDPNASTYKPDSYTTRDFALDDIFNRRFKLQIYEGGQYCYIKNFM